jgi:hypothetical protein
MLPGMEPRPVLPPYDQLMETAEAVIRERPEVDADIVREVFREGVTLLDDGLVLDGLDEHDADAVVAGLCQDLVAPDPGAAVRARSRETAEGRGEPGLHDPQAVARVYLIAAATLKL